MKRHCFPASLVSVSAMLVSMCQKNIAQVSIQEPLPPLPPMLQCYNVSVSAMQPCSASFNSLPLPREYNITNMTAAKRYESVWNAFLNELSHNPTATLTSFLKRCNVRQGRMKRWMENNGLSVKEAKKRLRDCQHDGIGDPMSPFVRRFWQSVPANGYRQARPTIRFLRHTLWSKPDIPRRYPSEHKTW